MRCSTSDNPRRKLRHTLEMIRDGRIWVGLHTLRANQLVARALTDGAIPAFRPYTQIRPEVAVGGGSRPGLWPDGKPPGCAAHLY